MGQDATCFQVAVYVFTAEANASMTQPESAELTGLPKLPNRPFGAFQNPCYVVGIQQVVA